MKHKSDTSSSNLFPNNTLVILSLLVVIFFYIWFVSSSSEDQVGTTTYYYANLADAFLEGRLHLEVTGDMIPIDLSYYDGNFYIYWGPVPAIILAFINFFIQARVGDFFLAFVFVIGIFLMQSMLLLAVWNRYFQALPKWALYLPIISSGLTGPMILLRHYYDYARIYEAAIAAGQFFLLGGMLIAFIAMTTPSLPNWMLSTAGLLWALAIGSRSVLAAPIIFIIIITVVFIFRAKANFIEKIVKLIFLGLPMAIGSASIGWYNWVRFGSITETGFSYALAGVNIQEHFDEIFSQSYVIQNLYNYLINPPSLASNFPFVSMLYGRESAILPFYNVPDFYYTQQMTGFIYTLPFAVFSLIPPAALLSRLYNEKSLKILFDDNNNNYPIWITLSLSSSFLVAFGLLMFFFWAGMRYMGDFLPSMTVLSVLGFWQGYDQFPVHKSLAKNSYILTGVIFIVSSALLSTLLMISINPSLTG